MNEIVVLSGKGGTGKTSVTASLAHLAAGAVICDLDVDAPDLHLVLRPDVRQTTRFVSGNEARIDHSRCEACGHCVDHCHFGAISLENGLPVVNPLKCEGCKLCVALCPAAAIDFPEKVCGDWFRSETRFGPMVHAQLIPGEENSGRLVALLRREAKTVAAAAGAERILSDGPPGIGCPVISALSGANLAVIVTEPTPSGLHDLVRIIDLCENFTVPAGVIINKHDLDREQDQAVQRFCTQRRIPLFGRLPYDPVVVEAMIRQQAVTEYRQGRFTDALTSIWRKIKRIDDRQAITQ